VIGVLKQLGPEGGLPRGLALDSDSWFTSLGLLRRAREKGVGLTFIESGKPIQNAFAESFHVRLRDECLNESSFFSLAEAREVVEPWRVDYNTRCPHGSIGRIPPAEFLRRFKQSEESASELVHIAG
jgi:putative transposase